MKLVTPGPAGGQILTNEAGFEFLDLGGNLFWIMGVNPVVDQTIQVRSGGRIARLPLSSVLTGGKCGEPQTVVLEVEQRIFDRLRQGRAGGAPPVSARPRGY